MLLTASCPLPVIHTIFCNWQLSNRLSPAQVPPTKMKRPEADKLESMANLSQNQLIVIFYITR